MADFCNQCAKELGFDPGDMAHLMEKEKYDDDHGVLVLCEDCGPSVVDYEGNCIAPDCWKRHGRRGENVE